MTEADYSIGVLTPFHDVSAFTSAHKALEVFLKKHALKNAKNHLGRTYVLTQGNAEVLGYYTLATCGVSRNIIPARESLPRYDNLPGLLLGRLAVKQDRMRRGLGLMLMGHLFEQCWAIAQQVGVYLLSVDAKDSPAKAFYQNFKFAELDDDPFHLFVSMSEIGRALKYGQS